MNSLLFTFDNIFFLAINNTILDMTINNPIFILTLITVIWFIPGIVVRRFKEANRLKIKKKEQVDAINKLYPKHKD